VPKSSEALVFTSKLHMLSFLWHNGRVAFAVNIWRQKNLEVSFLRIIFVTPSEIENKAGVLITQFALRMYKLRKSEARIPTH